MAWTTPRDWTDGELVTEALLDTHVRDNLLALTTWTSYTPTWTATGGTPTIGNGTLAGEYIKTGQICHVRVTLTFGSTTSVSGTTNWQLSLPFAAVGPVAGSFVFYDASAAMQSGQTVRESGGSTILAQTGASAYVGATSPATWATGDYGLWTATYRVSA